MPTLTIDGQQITVEDGATVLEAARRLGIDIPTMCHVEGRTDRHVSCMICVVRQEGAVGIRPGFVPSCQFPALEGMVVDASSEAVRRMRTDILEVILSDHIGDCEGPCENTCPAHMAIPVMMRQVDERDAAAAMATVRADIALPAVLGRICPEVCEKACRRGDVDAPVAICRVKRFVGDGLEGDPQHYPPPAPAPASGHRVAVVGAGPAGLAAAYYLALDGHACTVFDAADQPGGALRSIAPDILPPAVLEREIATVLSLGQRFEGGRRLGQDLSLAELRRDFAAVFLALGRVDDAALADLGLPAGKGGKVAADVQTLATTQAGLFAGGDMLRQRRLAIRSVADGKIAACSISQFLRGETPSGEVRRFNSRTGRLALEEIRALVPGALSSDPRQEPGAQQGCYQPDEARCEAARCLHCDCVARDTCRLRALADAYGAKQGRYKGQRRPIHPVLIGEAVIYEHGKCMHCGACVYVCQQAGQKAGLSFANRGFELEVTIPLRRSIDAGLDGIVDQVVSVCPTGALSHRRDFGGVFVADQQTAGVGMEG